MKSLYLLTKKVIYLTAKEKWLKNKPKGGVLFTTADDLISEKTLKEEYGFSEVFEFKSYDTNPNLELEAIKLYEKYKFNKVISMTEFDVERSARIRTYLNISGQKTNDSIIFRDKLKMRKHAYSKGIKVPQFKAIRSVLDAYVFIDEVSFPVILKPRLLAGSKGIIVLNNWDNFNETVNEFSSIFQATGNYIIEKFIEGELFHIDGIVLDGKLECSFPSKYINCTTSKISLGSFLLSNRNPLKKRLSEYSKNLLENGFAKDNSFIFHLETFLQSDGEIVLCEIGSRLGGGKINNTIFSLYGIDLKMEFIKSETIGKKVVKKEISTIEQSKDTIAGWSLIRQREGIFRGIKENLKINNLLNFDINATVGKKYSLPTSSNDHYASVIIKGENESKTIEDLNKAVETIMNNSYWE